LFGFTVDGFYYHLINTLDPQLKIHIFVIHITFVAFYHNSKKTMIIRIFAQLFTNL